MAPRIRSSQLETRTSRARLTPGKHTQMLAPCIHALYRKNALAAGSWSLLVKRKPEYVRKIGLADDREDANGETILSYPQMVEKCFALARDGEGNSGAVATVLESVEAYKDDLEAAGRSTYNATTLMKQHLPPMLAGKSVALLKKRDFTTWWASMLAKGLAPESVARYAKSLRSALNQAADDDARIKNRKVWKEGLRGPAKNDDDETEPVRNNFILPDATVTAIMYACHDEATERGDDFGLLIDIMSECGARESQVWRLKPRHLNDDDPAKPVLTVPKSRKGLTRKKTAKKKKDYDVPISPRLAALLRQKANTRTGNEPLLVKVWDVADRFRAVIKSLGLDTTLLPYCLRYSSINRALLSGTPMALVATNHDTSTQVIEAFYARYINKSKKGDELSRASLIDHSRPGPASNVTPITIRAATSR
ncbi:hypothetical protein [Bradyrhizobium sp. WYCCWR 12699]|uniref:hypothetical protein n=1 Tax=Bradyrhizobium sp. WYCCWR 12699 TaxID=3064203 RepID=UPI0028A47455|nr:hypothetical protein [Bradyrhizobium sp. WYCCWR 12699]MDT4739260.1 hypothetical protein [Bradyrhizobium sp. WYCCWR 12699]